MKLELSKIRRDGGTQSRAQLDMSVVSDYAESMSDSVVFPPLKVVYDGENYWLYDGFHRSEAALRIGLTEFEVEIIQGTQREAVLLSTGVNAQHGLRRSNADKRRAVETLLLDPEWSQWSDRQIAARVGVSAPMVGGIRRDLIASGKILQSDVRRGGDGREINTANIGAKHWGQDGGMAFWRRVDDLKLDKSTVLQRLQSGATNLTDLNLSKQEAIEGLDKLHRQDLEEQFPFDCYVMHEYSRRVAVVKGYDRGAVNVYDEKRRQNDLWQTRGIRRATLEENKAYVEADGAAVPGKFTQLSSMALQNIHADDWIDRYRKIKARVAPNKKEDPLLMVHIAGGSLMSFDDDAQALAGCLNAGEWLCKQTDLGFVVFIRNYTDQTFAPLWAQGCSGVYWYREVSTEASSFASALTRKDEHLPVDEQPPADEQQRFSVGDKVTIEGSSIVGDVIEIKPGGMVCVRRPHPSADVNMTHWVKDSRVSPAQELPEQPALWLEARNGILARAGGKNIADFHYGTEGKKLAEYVAQIVNVPARRYIDENDQPELLWALHKVGQYAAGEREIYDGIDLELDMLAKWVNGLRDVIAADKQQKEVAS